MVRGGEAMAHMFAEKNSHTHTYTQKRSREKQRTLAVTEVVCAV